MTGQSWTLAIPAPAPWLNANQRGNRKAQAAVVRAWRDAAAQHARAARLPRLARARIIATLRFTDERRRDPANWAPTAKAAVDGLVDAGVFEDDSSKYVIGPDMRLGDPMTLSRYGPVGHLVLTIEAVTVDA